MIRLNTTTRSLRAFLAGAVATTQLPITVGYSDGTSANYTGAAQLTLTNGATPVTVCAAPGSGLVRDIDYIAVSNVDTAAATVTIQVNDNGSFFEQVKATLQPGRQLVYTHAQGWNVGPTDATPLPAAPSASVGLAMVPGVATTYMRSDAAPPLSQAIAPTWTATHTFNNPIVGSVTGSSGSTTGNAATATALQTARTINGVAFDGTANIVIPGANPTGTVGLAAVNGVATTFMRSDAAPPLSQAIVPTWTGVHTWNFNAAAAPVAFSASTLRLNGADGVAAILDISSFAIENAIYSRRANGTGAVPTALAVNDNMFIIRALGYGGGAYSASTRSAYAIRAAEAWTGAAQGTYHAWFGTPVGSTVLSQVMTLDGAGNLLLGSAATPVARLSVVSATAMGAATTNWANYAVFGPNAGSAVGSALGLGYNTTSTASELLSLQPGVAWRRLDIFSNGINFNSTAGVLAGGFDASGNTGLASATPGAITGVDIGAGTLTSISTRTNASGVGAASVQARAAGVTSVFLTANNTGADVNGVPTNSIGIGSTNTSQPFVLTTNTIPRMIWGGLGPINLVNSSFYPSTPAKASQSAVAIYGGTGAPNNADGNNGDVYHRGDTPATANQRIYIKSAGAWIGIV